MGQDTGSDTETRAAEWTDWSRRNVLKLSGAGVGLAAVGGVSLAAGQDDDDDEGQEGTETPTGTVGTAEETGGALVDDLIDPTFGYPLAADETGAVSVDSTVDLVSEQGEGAHAEFPVSPQSEGAFGFEFYFDPVGVRVEPDEVVQFTVESGEHTVTALHEKFSIPERQIPTRVPDESPGFTSPPVLGGESWVYQFPTEGVYDVLCLPHFGFGMVARIVVAASDTDEGSFEAPTEGELPPNAATVFAAEELDPANIVSEGTIAWADLTLEPVAGGTPGGETPGTGTPESFETTATETPGTEPEGG